MKVKIWHNPRCTKSRQALALLEEKGIDTEIYLYMKEPPSKAAIKDVLKSLGITAHELARTKEDAFKEQNLAEATEEALIDAMTKEPKLIERPIVISTKGAAIGRPTENVLEVI